MARVKIKTFLCPSAVQEGRLRNPSAVAGILAAAVSRSQGWNGLRPVTIA